MRRHRTVLDAKNMPAVMERVFPDWKDGLGFHTMRRVARTVIDSSLVADLREIAATNDCGLLRGVVPSGLTIGAAVEIATLAPTFPDDVGRIARGWISQSPVLSRAAEVFSTGVLPAREGMWNARGLEFFPIRGPNWANAGHYHPFESRLKKAAKDAGFGNMATALSGALFEMADNIAQHSGSDVSRPAPGLICYHVSPGNVSFAVSDAGRGVLNSLKENPAWTQLGNSKAGLMAIVEHHASRRIHGGDGEGFKQVFRSLLDHNGLVELRSFEGRVRLVCAPDGSRQAQPQFTGSLPGFQIAISCSLKGPAKEVIFPIDYLT